MRLYDLRCEYQREPMGVGPEPPRFFWKQDGVQESYRLLIASTAQACESGIGDVYDSKEVQSSACTYIEAPIQLQELTRYYWCVLQSSGERSKVASFVSGVWNWGVPFLSVHGVEGMREMSEQFRFWRRVELKDVAATATGYIAVTSRGYHELWVNGRRAGQGVLAPNRSHIAGNVLLYNTYDVSGLLKTGENIIELICDAGWCRKDGLIPCVAVKGRMDTAELTSAQVWHCGSTGQWCTGDYAWGNFGGEHLTNAPIPYLSNTLAPVPLNLDAVIRSDSAPSSRVVAQLHPVSIQGGNPCVIDMGRNFTGFVRMQLKAQGADANGAGTYGAPYVPAPGRMTVSDKAEEACSFNQVYTLAFDAGATGEFCSRFNYLSGRYLYLEGVETPKPSDITGLVVSNLYEQSGAFTCSNADYNAIFAMDTNTLIANTVGGVTMDCPHRERLGYGETGCSTTWGIGLPLFDSAAFYAAYLRAWCDCIGPDGHFPHVAPEFWGGGGVAWSNFPLIGFLDFYKKYPDARLLRDVLPALRAWLIFLDKQCVNGLLARYEHEEWGFLGDWATPEGDDWGDSRQAYYFNNCCYAYALLRARELADAAKDAEMAREVRKLHSNLAKNIRREFYADGYFCAPHARYQAAALVSGVAAVPLRKSTYRRMLAIIKQKGYLDGGSAGLILMLRELYRTQEGRHAVLAWLQSENCPGYLHFLRCGQTTLPEMWDMRDIYGGSRIHTCYSGIASFFIKVLAGINTEHDRVVISPLLHKDVKVDRLSAKEELLQGTVAVQYERNNGALQLTIDIPYGCTAMLRFNGNHALQAGRNTFQFPDC